MIVNIIEKYSEIVLSYNIQQFKIVGSSYHLAYHIKLIDNSQLFSKDYLFLDGSRKYSFHWQDGKGHCIIRWDNAPHHQDVITFPYHQHIGKEEDIKESQPMKLETVMECISNQINP